MHGAAGGRGSVNGGGERAPTARNGERDGGIFLMNNTCTVHPFNDALVLVGASASNQDDVAVFVGEVVPIGAAPADAADVEAAVGDVGAERSLGEKTNPCVRGTSRSLTVGVGDGRLVVQHNVLVGS